MTFNRIHIVGHLGRDPELRKTAQGLSVCELALATDDKRKDENTTTWFRVTLWGSQAETASQYLTKGRLVYVEGSLRAREWTDREGKMRTTLEVNGSEMKFLDSNREAA